MELKTNQCYYQKQFNNELLQKANYDLTQKYCEKQIFSIIYDGCTFKVDPFCLSKSSLRFNEIIKPYIHDHEQMKTLHLEIHCSQFTKRNMNNFLCICHNLPTDVQNSEMKEICEIARLFKADDIYNTGITFIQTSLDPNFAIPDSKYDSNNNIMAIKKEKESTQAEMQFNIKLYDIQNAELPVQQINEDNYDSKHVVVTEYYIDTHKNIKEKGNNCKSRNKKKNSVIYSVKVENHVFKGKIFKMFKENKILYIAEQKINEIFIVERCEINLRSSSNHIGYIYQNGTLNFNTIKVYDQSFDLNYVNDETTDQLSLEVSFPSYNQVNSWFPKPLKYTLDRDHYFLNFQGHCKRRAIMSPKNLVLQNYAKHTTFIVRQMTKTMFEFECNPNVDPLIAFTIGLSDIVGPYKDPWSYVNAPID